MKTIELSLQDALCFEAMTAETRSLIYYGLHALIAEIGRAAVVFDPLLNDHKIQVFRENVRQAAKERHVFLANNPTVSLSLVHHFAPMD